MGRRVPGPSSVTPNPIATGRRMHRLAAVHSQLRPALGLLCDDALRGRRRGLAVAAAAAAAARPTLLYHHASFGRHIAGDGHPEQPLRYTECLRSASSSAAKPAPLRNSARHRPDKWGREGKIHS